KRYVEESALGGNDLTVVLPKLIDGPVAGGRNMKPGGLQIGLEESERLLADGYHQAAAVMGRIALERLLRSECERLGIAGDGARHVSEFRSAMTKRGCIEPQIARKILRLEDIGNRAAHGHPIAAEEAREIIDGVRSLSVTLTAKEDR